MTALPLPSGAASAPHFDQLLGGWAMLPEAFQLLAQQLSQLDIPSHMSRYQQTTGTPRIQANGYRYATIAADGIATVPVYGAVTKQDSSFSDLFGGTSSVMLRRDIRQATIDDAVGSILLVIESPGGTARGNLELFDDLRAASKVKPVWAFIEDLGASAAYWIACGCSRITANRFAQVGSIGTYTVVVDTSKREAAMGISTYVIAAGDYKGASYPGTELTEAQRAELERSINDINDIFVESVSVGRKVGIDAARKLADGRVHVAGGALRLGLIDEVGTLDRTRAMLAALHGRRPAPKQTRAPGLGFPVPKASRLAEGFLSVCNYVKQTNKVSFSDAYDLVSKAYPELRRDYDRKRARESASSAAIVREDALNRWVADQQAAKSSPSVATLPVASARSRWEAAIEKHTSRGVSRSEAARIANRLNPGLREEFLAESAKQSHR